MVHHRQVIARFVRPGVREETPVAVLVVADQDSRGGNAVVAYREFIAAAGLETAWQIDMQAIVLVSKLQRRSAGRYGRDRHALSSARCRDNSTPASGRLSTRIRN